MIASRFAPFTLLLFVAVCPSLCAQRPLTEADLDREVRHSQPEWLIVAPHLPDLATATPATLEVAGDVLRARRLPDDALDFYRAAIKRGGDEERLQNRVGITLLELHQAAAARMCFRRAVLLKKKDADGWNNLGASEYVMGNFTAAVQGYQRAVKLNKKRAVFHSNLGTAYFDLKDYESAQKQFDVALTLDRDIFQHGGFGGVEAHVMSPADRGKFCFEMARLSAKHHDDAGVLQWLAQATETGYDVRYQMAGDKNFEPYVKDARVALLIKNAKAMRAGQVAVSSPVPALAGGPAR